MVGAGREGSCLPQGVLEAEIRTGWGSQCPLQGHTLNDLILPASVHLVQLLLPPSSRRPSLQTC